MESRQYRHSCRAQLESEATPRLSVGRSGRVHSDCHVAMMSFIRGNYRLIYRTGNDRIDILTVFHSARLLDETEILVVREMTANTARPQNGVTFGVVQTAMA